MDNTIQCNIGPFFFAEKSITTLIYLDALADFVAL